MPPRLCRKYVPAGLRIRSGPVWSFYGGRHAAGCPCPVCMVSWYGFWLPWGRAAGIPEKRAWGGGACRHPFRWGSRILRVPVLVRAWHTLRPPYTRGVWLGSVWRGAHPFGWCHGARAGSLTYRQSRSIGRCPPRRQRRWLTMAAGSLSSKRRDGRPLERSCQAFRALFQERT